MSPKQELLFEEAKFDARGFFEGFTAKLLGTYAQQVQAAKAPRSKELNDPVWETLTLHPVEVILLDSPLFQRLRLIRQLGVAHYVYPGTTHTRLEHSLGVLHQMQRLIDAINASISPPAIDASMTRLLRLIALSHDLGHGVMSHVAENALKQYPDVEDVELAFMDAHGRESAKLSEIAAYYIVGSPSFRNLLKVAHDKARELLPEGASETMQKAIVGESISDDFPLLNELISGPFDADKLDYMTRDAKMAGVPVVTDIPRLVKKVRAVSIPRSELPNEIAAAVKERTSYVMMGIALSGGRTLDELMLGRTLLFDKIYRHQKVRAAEAMVAGVIRCLVEATGRSPVEIPYLITDDEVINLNATKIATLAGRSLSADEERWAHTAAELSQQLRNRRLVVRAFAFAQAMPLDPHRHNPSQRRGLEHLARDAADGAKREGLIEAIIGELRKVVSLLPNASSLLPAEHLNAYITLDPPSTAPPGGDITRAYLITPTGKLTRFREDAAEARGWADAYLLTRDVGYIFSPPEFAPHVCVAAQTVVRQTYGVQLPDSMLAYAKQDPDTMLELRRQLAAKGYYKQLAHDLRPIPERLTKADVRNKIEEFVANVAGYQGAIQIQPDETVSKAGMDYERVLCWLRQFEDDDLIGEALDMLRQFRLIGRREATTAVSSFVDDNPEFRGAHLCPLGSVKDSSAIATYYAHDVAERYQLESATLPNALASKAERPIIFADDFVGSGNQAISILEQWLGADPSVDLGEVRDEALSDDTCAALRKRKLGFVFSAGMATGPSALQKRCAELGLDAKVKVLISAADLPRAFDHGQRADLRDRCREIGDRLLQEDGQDPSKSASRALGYGNEALLVVFPYNTPSQTLTCVWKGSTIDGVPWQPLFPRRKKR